MKQPLISIIIPTYNRAHCIEVALQSLVDQTYATWECLVVDDGSTDTGEVVISNWVRRDTRFQYYTRNRLPKGAPTCRNIGLEKATGNYVVFLDSDDYLLPHCLAQRVVEILKNPTCDFLVFPMAIKKKEEITKQEIPVCADYLIPFLSAKLPWSIVCPIWKRTTLTEARGFKENYLRFNDPELMIRVLMKPAITYKVCQNADFDCVILPSPKDSGQFSNKVFKSLNLLIRDASKALELERKANFKFYLAGYLHLWFKYIFTPTKSKNPKQSMLLLVLFYRKDIISFRKMLSLTMRLFIYTSTSMIMQKPMNKLIDRGFYLETK